MLKKLDHPLYFFEKGMQAQAVIYLSSNFGFIYEIKRNLWPMIHVWAIDWSAFQETNLLRILYFST